MDTVKKRLAPIGATVTTALVSAQAAAEESGGDVSQVADAVDFSSVTPALLTVGGAIAGVIVTFVGVRWVISMVRRG